MVIADGKPLLIVTEVDMGDSVVGRTGGVRW